MVVRPLIMINRGSRVTRVSLPWLVGAKGSKSKVVVGKSFSGMGTVEMPTPMPLGIPTTGVDDDIASGASGTTEVAYRVLIPSMNIAQRGALRILDSCLVQFALQ